MLLLYACREAGHYCIQEYFMAKNIRLSDHFTYSKLLRFTLPSIVMMVFTSIYGVVDGLFVSNFVGKTAFASVNLVMPFVMILGGMGFMIGTGGTALVSKILGEGDPDTANRTFSMMVLFTLALGIVLSAAGIVFMRPVSRFLGATDAMMDDCVLYGRIVTGFTFAFMLQNVFQSFFIAAEKPKLGLKVTVAAGLANMVLDALFIAVFNWGVAGAAIATVLSQIASCGIGFAYMHRRYALLRFSLRELRMDLKTAGRILQVGAPMAIQQSIVSCGFLFLQKLVNLFGESMIASYTVASRMENILMIPIIGIQNTMATFAGQNMGAQRPDRVSKGLGQGVLVSLGMTLILCLAQIAGIPLIIRAFQLDAGAADICRLHLFSSAVAIPIFAVYFPANGMCQGVGEGFHATFYALLALGLRVVFAYALHKTSLFGYTAIWWSQAMSWTITLVVCYVHFFRGKWKDKSLIS